MLQIRRSKCRFEGTRRFARHTSAETGDSAAKRASTPAQVVLAERQVTNPLAGDLVDRIADRGLHRRRAVVPHADEPMRGREELDVDLERILVDARQRKLVEVVLDDSPRLDVACLVYGVVVEPGDLALDLLLHR